MPRRTKTQYMCSCFCFSFVIFVIVRYHTNSFLTINSPVTSVSDATENAKSHIKEPGKPNMENAHQYERLTFHGAKDAIRNVFNLGEVIRNNQMHDVEIDESLSPTEIENLKAQNFCPNAYRLSNSFIAEHTKIKHVSNLTRATANAQNNHTGSISTGDNSTVINNLFKTLPRISILTPISNSANQISHYFKLLCSLSYPHDLISISIGEDSSTDRSFELAHVHSRTLKQYYNGVDVYHFDDVLETSHFGKHDEFFQFKRRSHLAHARNQLLFRGLRDADYVLWLDSDVKYVPPDIIEHLLAAQRDVIVPACMFKKENSDSLEVYDRNSWRETERSRDFLKRQSADFLKLEGYTASMRELLPEIKPETEPEVQGHVVPLDGVGGCALMVRAQCHRKGLIFPPFIFEHHIETEGLAKMAKAMGYGVYGYPRTYVIHW